MPGAPGRALPRPPDDRLGLADGEEYGFDLFHAERRRDRSALMIKSSFVLEDAADGPLSVLPMLD